VRLEAQSDPSGRRPGVRRVSRIDPEALADGEGPGRRAEGLERITLGEVRDEIEAHARRRERLARAARRVRVSKAGDEVPALLDEPERAVERHDAEHAVVPGLARNDQPGVFQPRQTT
jgi:hypothetical protein